MRTGPLTAAAAGAAYLAVLLALDHFANYHEQLALGVLTWAVLFTALSRVSVERRAQTLAVVAFATIGEVTGSLIWGVYHYRLHNLPLFVPPAHGIVYLTGLSLAYALRRHRNALVATAGVAAATWGLLGLTVLPRRDVAGAIGVPLLLVFLARSRYRAIYASVFLVVAALELYGTAIGTWRWEQYLPGLHIPDGNPPSGVASGYVWFDVMALLVAPYVGALTRRSRRAPDELRAPAQSLPHLDHEALPENTLADAERWAARLSNPPYAIDDQTAIRVADDTVDVVSEGHWKLFAR
ncbi:MAG TPA: hypothetical protein VF094_05420 [Gaiellaceae bacterium]